MDASGGGSGYGYSYQKQEAGRGIRSMTNFVSCRIMPSMLNPERISIGRLKQAYGLSALEVDELLAALWPNGVFPYDLWEKAYTSYWKDAALHNAAFHLAGAAPVLPEIDQKLAEMYATTPLYPYQTLVVKFFESLSAKIFVSDLEKGFRYITEEAIGDSINEFKEKIDYIFDRLSDTEKEYDLRIFSPYCWAVNMSAERFRELMDTKILSVPSSCYFFISDLFTDTIIVDKSAAVRHLFNCGYPLRQEVKGISRAIVEHITAALPARPQDAAPSLPPAAINVPRALWEGKSPAAIRDAMKKAEFDESVIAYVLFEWHGLTNKTRLGRLLSKKEQDEKSYRNLVDRLLDKAAALTIESV
ncbi:MAG: hypothetical protein LBU75_05090 [Desulfovibrio sp.]|nr:hypothetical protein [Desulfovibrio sp.]